MIFLSGHRSLVVDTLSFVAAVENRDDQLLNGILFQPTYINGTTEYRHVQLFTLQGHIVSRNDVREAIAFLQAEYLIDFN
jgi:hypothetical protein